MRGAHRDPAVNRLATAGVLGALAVALWLFLKWGLYSSW